MRLTLRLAGLLLAFSAILAVAASDEALVEKRVFPLVKEGDLWWAGVADVCAIAGATFEGDGFTYAYDEKGMRIRIGGQFGGEGPFTIRMGGDRYEFRLDKLDIQKNGEAFGDFLLQPKRIDAVVSATLEDLARILDCRLGEEVEGQPTMAVKDQRYRLVKGQRRNPLVQALEGHAIQVVPFGEGFPNHPENGPPVRGPYILRPGGVITVPNESPSPYVEHNGMLYRRGTPRLQFGPHTTPMGSGEEMLFGPVVRDRFHADGQSADLMYLSIVKRPRREPFEVRIAPPVDPGADREGRR